MAITLDGTNGISTPDLESAGQVTGTTGTFSGAVSGTTGTFSGAVQASGVATNLYPLVSGTAQASTSGTSIDFTGIPSWAKQITVMLNGVSTNGTSLPLIQLGTSSGVTTSGYTSFADNSYGAGASQTTGFGIERIGAAATSRIGIAVIANISGNGWVFSYNGVQTGSSISSGAGSVSLAAVLDRVRITTVGGADTFDAGTINIMYE